MSDEVSAGESQEQQSEVEAAIPTQKTSGAVAIEILNGQLSLEMNVKTSLEARGTSVIWTSASVLTVLLAASTLNWSQDGTAPTLSSWQFGLASAAFIIAVICGLAATWPSAYSWLNLDDKESGVVGLVASQEYMRTPSTFVERNFAGQLLDQLRAARKSNEHKAWEVKIGITAEAVAIFLLALRVIDVVYPGWLS
jgi:hypothetical protein